MRSGRTRLVRFAWALALVVVVAGVLVSPASALRFSDDSCRANDVSGCKPPEGMVGANYFHKLTGEGGNGPPYTYILKAGSLPPGLSLNSGNGQITGRATSAGTFNFDVELQDFDQPPPDWCNAPARQTCAVQPFSITILAGLSIETRSLPAGASVGVPYNAPLTAMLLTALSPPAGFAPSGVVWSVASGVLPPGMTLTNGAVTGTPTAEGTFTFVVKAELDAKRVDTETLSLTVRQPLQIKGTPPRSEVGAPFKLTLGATGGAPAYTWTLEGTLPPGVALAADGTISGTPTTAGVYRFTAKATDTETRTATFAGVVNVAPKLAITTLRVKPGKVGKLYRQKLATTGGVLPKKWKVIGRLPRGVRFDKTLGVLSGTPLKAGTYRITVEVTDALKVKSTKTFTIVVLG